MHVTDKTKMICYVEEQYLESGHFFFHVCTIKFKFSVDKKLGNICVDWYLCSSYLKNRDLMNKCGMCDQQSSYLVDYSFDILL